MEDDSIFQLRVVMLGAEGTPYEDGEFTIRIQLPEDYPFEMPKAFFVTKIWHPNINPNTGQVCFDMGWNAEMKLISFIVAIQSLLCGKSSLSHETNYVLFVSKLYIKLQQNQHLARVSFTTT